MAELNMSNATYGRDTAGRKKLLTDLEGKINNAVKLLKGKEFTDIKNVVNANWSGVDADKFLDEIEADVSDLQNSYKKAFDIIQAALEMDAKNFAATQENVASSINR